MLYKTHVPMVINGDYFKRDSEIELSHEEIKQYDTADLSPVSAIVEPRKKPDADVPLEKMSYDQLKAKAKELGLSTSGSKAAITERITLHLQEQENQEGDEDETDEDENQEGDEVNDPDNQDITNE